jgi:Flp pilus assembly protein TadD
MNGNYDDEESELSATGFIACKACGARIRANRDACLRCGEPLEAAPQTVTLATISSGRQLAIALVIVAAVVGLVVLVWVNRPAVEQESARAAEGPGAARGAAVASGAPATPSAKPAAVPQAATAPDDGENFVEVPQSADAGSEDPVAKHVALAVESARQAEWGRVSGEYRLAVEQAPNNAVLRYNLAIALHKLGDDQSAIAEYEFAIRLAPTQARFHRSMGTSLAKMGKAVEAQQEFQKYLDMDPSAPDEAMVRARIEELASAKSSTAP